jgi:hypothetical protein
MHYGLPERIANRLRRVRHRFGKGVGARQVDDDHDHLTGTRREQVPKRTFFLGEIWWAERAGLGESRPRPESASHVPALVTERQDEPGERVELAPGTPGRPRNPDAIWFEVLEPPGGLRAGTGFLLSFRRPVGRERIGAPIGALNGREKQRLSVVLGGLSGSPP